MTIATTTNRVDASGNGSATSFSFSPVVIFEASDLQVTVRDSSGNETVIVAGAGSANYSVSVTAYPGTGSITYPASGGTPLPAGSTIVIKRIVPLLQSVSLSNQGAYFPKIQEGEYDYLTAIDQQQQEQVGRSIQLSPTDAPGGGVLPSAALRVNTILGFDNNGLPVMVKPPSAAIQLGNKALGIVTVLDFGATGNGSTDDTAAINSAFAATDAVYVPAGNYKISGVGALINRPNATITGAGSAATKFTYVGTGGSAVTMTGGNASLSGLRITRTGVPTSTATGFDASASLNNPKISDIEVDGHYNGLVLASCAFGSAEKIISNFNYGSGFLIAQTGAAPTNQWDLRNCLSQMNDLYGFLAQSNGVASQMILGTWTNCTSFANGQYGCAILGSAATPIQDGRWKDCFFSTDGFGGFYMDSYGHNHSLDGCFAELAGAGTTGKTMQIAATHTGNGFTTLTHDFSTKFDGCWADANSFSGFAIVGAYAVLTGCLATHNNIVATAGGAGITLGAGTVANIVGGYLGNIAPANAQNYGVSGPNGGLVTLTGVNLSTNSVAPTNFALNPNLVPAFGCVGFVSHPGAATASDALAGQIGEYVHVTVLAGAAVTLTTATAADVTSIALTAGDWDVSGTVAFLGGASTATSNMQGWISATSATPPAAPDEGGYACLVGSSFTFTGGGPALPTGTTRLNLASPTTIYLSTYSAFTVSTLKAFGTIRARRVR